jgi:hypothetical protein
MRYLCLTIGATKSCPAKYVHRQVGRGVASSDVAVSTASIARSIAQQPSAASQTFGLPGCPPEIAEGLLV